MLKRCHDRKEKIQGENIYITLVEEEDVGELVKFEVKNRDFFQPFFRKQEDFDYTTQGQWEIVKKAIEDAQTDRGYLFLIYLQESNELIGKVMLNRVMRLHLQSCWIGYTLDQDYNGRGYMSESVKLVVVHAFQELNLHRIEAAVLPHNLGSISVLLKNGFHKEGIARKSLKVNGNWEDHQILAIINESNLEK
ncbi:GNAT family N-acetyltransferase [Thermoactinomyces sp. DSM 45892]|uniref:GNAT family N-acetyltransferase n=1 Tax=Thermoactinomyces sp. DSM 45892 TaxID=1882753 RepID=UPI00089BC886|nr:GNAT family protein [Thermoactinomyces sp. DSM 45892]SDZ30377.1 ribosomal-protein-alanine N-acetyltransferase [Thermoactinomyces sp. DSM 45892]